MPELILEPLEKALDSLQKALQPKDEFVRDAAIQRFEYSFELSWKTLKRYLTENSAEPEFNIKNIFREAARQQLITEAEPWFEFHKARNLTTHTYNEDTAEETYQAALKFLPEAKHLLAQLKGKTNGH